MDQVFDREQVFGHVMSFTHCVLDLPQVLQTPVPTMQSLNTPPFVQGNVAEPFVNLRLFSKVLLIITGSLHGSRTLECNQIS